MTSSTTFFNLLLLNIIELFVVIACLIITYRWQKFASERMPNSFGAPDLKKIASRAKALAMISFDIQVGLLILCRVAAQNHWGTGAALPSFLQTSYLLAFPLILMLSYTAMMDNVKSGIDFFLQHAIALGGPFAIFKLSTWIFTHIMH